MNNKYYVLLNVDNKAIVAYRQNKAALKLLNNKIERINRKTSKHNWHIVNAEEVDLESDCSDVNQYVGFVVCLDNEPFYTGNFDQASAKVIYLEDSLNVTNDDRDLIFLGLLPIQKDEV